MLVLGVLPGLLVAVILSLIQLMQRLARPPVTLLARDPATGAWGRAERHPDWSTPPGPRRRGDEGPLFYANALAVKDRLLAAVETAEPRPAAIVLDLGRNDEIDVGALDMLADLARRAGARRRRAAADRACTCRRWRCSAATG